MRAFLKSFMAVAALGCGSQFAQAGDIPDIVIQCDCTTLQELKDYASLKGMQHAKPHIPKSSTKPGYLRFNIGISSTTAEVTALFAAKQFYSTTGLAGITALTNITLSEEEAETLDMIVFSKGIRPIPIPSSTAEGVGTATMEDVNSYIRQNFPITLAVFGGGYQMLDPRTGTQHSVKQNVTVITVTFEDGSSVQLLLTNPMSTIAWSPVPGSERNADGKPRLPDGASRPISFVRESAPSTFTYNGATFTWHTGRTSYSSSAECWKVVVSYRQTEGRVQFTQVSCN